MRPGATAGRHCKETSPSCHAEKGKSQLVECKNGAGGLSQTRAKRGLRRVEIHGDRRVNLLLWNWLSQFAPKARALGSVRSGVLGVITNFSGGHQNRGPSERENRRLVEISDETVIWEYTGVYLWGELVRSSLPEVFGVLKSRSVERLGRSYQHTGRTADTMNSGGVGSIRCGTLQAPVFGRR